MVRSVVLGALSFSMGVSQDPGPRWTPTNWKSLGIYCEKGANNPNDPAGHLNGGCGCENTPLRIRDRLLMMESHDLGCDDIFPWYDSNKFGDCSFFRIRDLLTGHVIANVSESIGHSYCSAVVDYERETLWVFCPAHARGNTKFPGPCDVSRGCYIGAWSAQFNDLTKWTQTRKVLSFADGQSLYNPDVALVSGNWPASQGTVRGLPRHQAVMVLEGRSLPGFERPGPFAVNVGDDGDLGKNWVSLNASEFDARDETGTGTGTTGAAKIVFDSEEGYYYTIGGGYITNGPARSRNLTSRSWKVSPLAPMAIPDAVAAQVGLPPLDQLAGFNTHFYSETWVDGVSPSLHKWLKNSTAWNWGVTDVDTCCSDGKAPSFIINTLSRQGAPGGVGKSYVYNRLGQSNLTENEWYRSYFPDASVSALLV